LILIFATQIGWAAADVTKFANMLKNVYLPTVINGSNSNGNWELGTFSNPVIYPFLTGG
jgi:hypothetical protein